MKELQFVAQDKKDTRFTQKYNLNSIKGKYFKEHIPKTLGPKQFRQVIENKLNR